jgi:hypothetical protein
MLRHLGHILGLKRRATPQEADIDLTQVEGAVAEVAGFPRADWKKIHEWIKSNVPVECRPAAMTEANAQWMGRIRRRMHEPHALYESRHFLFLSTQRRERAKMFMDMAERGYDRLAEFTVDIQRTEPRGKLPILGLGHQELYYRYVCYFEGNGKEKIASGGMFIRSGCDHIAIPEGPGFDRTLLHELTHAVVADLPLPRWVNEGLAQVMEDLAPGYIQRHLEPEFFAARQQKQTAYWRAYGIGPFWTGDSFWTPASCLFSYELAQEIVRDIWVARTQDFRNFILHAHRNDGGDAAAREYLGASVQELAAKYLKLDVAELQPPASIPPT